MFIYPFQREQPDPMLDELANLGRRDAGEHQVEMPHNAALRRSTHGHCISDERAKERVVAAREFKDQVVAEVSAFGFAWRKPIDGYYSIVGNAPS
jgi:hypothetical protein